jgi:chromosome partitioning protein
MAEKAVVTLFLALSGGQGKSLCSYTTGIKLSKLGYPTLLIDADPQHNLTDWLGVEIPPDHPTLLEVIKGTVSIEDAIYPVPNREHLFLVPCDRALGGVQFHLASLPNPSIVLRRKIEPILTEFSAVVIDSPPQSGHITLVSIGAADAVVIPVEATSKGIGSLIDSKNLLLECADARAFDGNLLGVIPFRAKLAGVYFTKDSRKSIEDMKELVGEEQIFAPVLESEVYKNCLNFGQIPSEFDANKAGLEQPFDDLIAVLRKHLPVVIQQENSGFKQLEEVLNG